MIKYSYTDSPKNITSLFLLLLHQKQAQQYNVHKRDTHKTVITGTMMAAYIVESSGSEVGVEVDIGISTMVEAASVKRLVVQNMHTLSAYSTILTSLRRSRVCFHITTLEEEHSNQKAGQHFSFD